jgi:cytochrome P450
LHFDADITRVHRPEGAKLAKDHLHVFGGGVSMCPGRYFALNEVKAFVATIISCCDITLAPGEAALPLVPNIDSSRVGLGIFSPLKDVAVNVSLR